MLCSERRWYEADRVNYSDQVNGGSSGWSRIERGKSRREERICLACSCSRLLSVKNRLVLMDIEDNEKREVR